MGLGTAKLHVLGRNQQFYVSPEASANPGQFLKPVTGDSMNVKTTSMVPNVPRKDRTDAYMATRDITERITQKSEHTWSVEAPYVPSGTKNTAPDCGELLKAGIGAETVNANDVTYSTNSSQAIPTVSLIRHFQDILQEAMAGCWVDEVTATFAGGQEPMIKFSGGAMDYAATGDSLLVTSLSGGESSFDVTAGEGVAFHDPQSAAVYARSVIQVGTSTDHVVSDRSTDTLTITDTISGAQAPGVTVAPYAPTHTDAGSPIAGITGSLTWDSLAFALSNFEITVKNNIKALADHAFVPHTDDIIPGFREITGKFSIRLRQDFIIKLLARQDRSTTAAIAVVAGGAAQSGTRVEIDCGYCEIDFTEISVPETEEATVDFTFKALGSSGNDAFTWKHT